VRIRIDSFLVQVVKKDMALEVIFIDFFIEEGSGIKRDK
jgi:hypothetical protein